MFTDDLPPVVSILLNEPPPTPESGEHWYLRIAPELRRQAQWSIDNYRYPERIAASSELVAVPTGGLDPYSAVASCPSLKCRLKNARQFARTIGLYAEHSFLQDDLTFRLAAQESLSDPHNLQRLIGDAWVLHELRPFIEAGIVMFRQASMSVYCEQHGGARFNELIARTADEVVITILQDLKLELGDDGTVELNLSDLYGYPMRLTGQVQLEDSPGAPASDKAKKVVSRLARALIASTVVAARDAAHHNGTVISSSRVSMLALRQLDRAEFKANKFEAWENSRTFSLPWISELSPAQIIELRQLAAEALPRLRESIACNEPSTTVDEKIHRLREEALEVKAELNALRSRHETLFRNVAGILGISAAVYGFAADAVPATPAIVGLLSLFGLIHTAEHKDSGEASRLRAKPGYVLLQAQQLLDHARD